MEAEEERLQREAFHQFEQRKQQELALRRFEERRRQIEEDEAFARSLMKVLQGASSSLTDSDSAIRGVSSQMSANPLPQVRPAPLTSAASSPSLPVGSDRPNAPPLPPNRRLVPFASTGDMHANAQKSSEPSVSTSVSESEAAVLDQFLFKQLSSQRHSADDERTLIDGHLTMVFEEPTHPLGVEFAKLVDQHVLSLLPRLSGAESTTSLSSTDSVDLPSAHVDSSASSSASSLSSVPSTDAASPVSSVEVTSAHERPVLADAGQQAEISSSSPPLTAKEDVVIPRNPDEAQAVSVAISEQLSSDSSDETARRAILEELSHSIHRCVRALLLSVVTHYRYLRSTQRRIDTCEGVVHRAVWARIYDPVMGALRTRLHADDEAHSAKIHEFLTVSPAHLGIPERFWLLPFAEDAPAAQSLPSTPTDAGASSAGSSVPVSSGSASAAASTGGGGGGRSRTGPAEGGERVKRRTLLWRSLRGTPGKSATAPAQSSSPTVTHQPKPAYHDAIKALRRIKRLQTPRAKLGAVVETARLVCSSVSEHWRGRLPPEKLVVGGDELLPLITYVLIKANVPHILVEVAFMEAFIPEDMAIRREGYLLATLQTALAFICCLHQDQAQQSAQSLLQSMASGGDVHREEPVAEDPRSSGAEQHFGSDSEHGASNPTQSESGVNHGDAHVPPAANEAEPHLPTAAADAEECRPTFFPPSSPSDPSGVLVPSPVLSPVLLPISSPSLQSASAPLQDRPHSDVASNTVNATLPGDPVSSSTTSSTTSSSSSSSSSSFSPVPTSPSHPASLVDMLLSPSRSCQKDSVSPEARPHLNVSSNALGAETKCVVSESFPEESSSQGEQEPALEESKPVLEENKPVLEENKLPEPLESQVESGSDLPPRCIQQEEPAASDAFSDLVVYFRERGFTPKDGNPVKPQ